MFFYFTKNVKQRVRNNVWVGSDPNLREQI